MNSERDRVVVGVDGSVGSQVALRWALDEAHRRHADLEIVTCWHPPDVAGASEYAEANLSCDDLTADTRSELDRVLHAVNDDINALIAHGSDVTSRLLEGPPGPRLVTESKGAAMLVVGRRGHGALVRLILGSVSSHVSDYATCPVVVVPDDLGWP
jgi:nucleotide-binding universal stress UspA family protein